MLPFWEPDSSRRVVCYFLSWICGVNCSGGLRDLAAVPNDSLTLMSVCATQAVLSF